MLMSCYMLITDLNMAHSMTSSGTSSINVKKSLKEFEISKSSLCCQIEPYLLVLNSNIHLKTICDEYSNFINLISSIPELSVFLKPVCQHLYDLLLYHNGMEDACSFLKAFKRWLPKDFYDQLQKKEEELKKEGELGKEEEHLSVDRIKVEPSMSAYLHLRRWLEEAKVSHLPNPSDLKHMTILRVLHENFAPVICENELAVKSDFIHMENGGNELLESETNRGRGIRTENKGNAGCGDSKMVLSDLSDSSARDKTVPRKFGQETVSIQEICETLDQMKMDTRQEAEESHFQRMMPSPSWHVLTVTGKDALSASDIHPQLRYVACGHESSNIRIWRRDTSRKSEDQLHFTRFCTLRGHKRIVHGVAADSNLPKLVSCSRDLTVRSWDLNRNECLSTFEKHTAAVCDVCISPNSKYFLSSSEDSTAVLYSYVDKDPLRVYTNRFDSEDANMINCVRFHPNCYYFATGSFNGTIGLWALDYTCPVRWFVGHGASVNSISFSPCGKYLASADDDGELIVWDINEQKLANRFSPTKRTQKLGIRSASYDKTGNLIAVALYENSWKVYNSASTEERGILWESTSKSILKSVHFCDDNSLFMVGWQEGAKTYN